MFKSAECCKGSRIPPGSVGFHQSKLKAASNLHCTFRIDFSSECNMVGNYQRIILTYAQNIEKSTAKKTLTVNVIKIQAHI